MPTLSGRALPPLPRLLVFGLSPCHPLRRAQCPADPPAEGLAKDLGTPFPFSGHPRLPGSADVLGAMPTCCVSRPGGRPWGLISFTTQGLPVPRDACLLPGLQTGPLSCAPGKALGANAPSPGTPNLMETSLHASAPLRSPIGQKESPSGQPLAGLHKL